MGFLDLFRRSGTLTNLPAVAPNGAPVNYDVGALRQVLGMSLEDLWRTQPHLRTVVGFLARNIAQLGLPSFERIGESDRQRSRDSVSAQLLSAPNETMTRYDLIYALVADRALYDIAYWWVARDADRPSGWRIDPIPPSWVIGSGGGNRYAPAWYDVNAPDAKKAAQRIDASEIIVFPGWNPGHPHQGSSPVDALKAILAEQIHAYIYRQQVWERGGRVGDVLTRPAGVEWSDAARNRFSADWAAKWSGDDGPKAGGTPILEDGMTLNKIRFSAHEEEWVEAAKLALATVAQVYYVNPTMIGLLDNANFSNVREFRKMLYGDTLGPEITDIDTRINTFLLPMIGEKPSVYVEFNIEEKLQGNFEEQTAALVSAVGAPWMTRGEARGLRNLPAIEGDDALVTPLNVLIGGQANPRDSASKGSMAWVGESGPRLVKSDEARRFKAIDLIPDSYAAKAEQVFANFFKRQAKVVLSRLGSKAGPSWWDDKRWDDELAADLFALAVTTSAEMGKRQAKALGFEADSYDVDRTLAFLQAVAASRAGMVNSTTRDRIAKALDAGDSPADVFTQAQSARSLSAGSALMTGLAGFALVEATKQVTGDRAAKQWSVNSSNPRSAHAAMDGETVGIDDAFSNGANWPGDPVLGADGVAGCQCTVEVIFN